MCRYAEDRKGPPQINTAVRWAIKFRPNKSANIIVGIGYGPHKVWRFKFDPLDV